MHKNVLIVHRSIAIRNNIREIIKIKTKTYCSAKQQESSQWKFILYEFIELFSIFPRLLLIYVFACFTVSTFTVMPLVQRAPNDAGNIKYCYFESGCCCYCCREGELLSHERTIDEPPTVHNRMQQAQYTSHSDYYYRKQYSNMQ